MGFSAAIDPIQFRAFPSSPSCSSPGILITRPFASVRTNNCHRSWKTTSAASQFVRNPIHGSSNNSRSSRGQGLSGARMSAVELQPSLTVKNIAAEISELLKGTSIFLVGMNGTMKTNLGKLLADSLRYYYFDSDSLVVQAAGVNTDAESFRKTDEQGFRDSETEVLKQLSSMGRLVVCAGEGAVQSLTNLSFIRYGISIWVDIPLDMLADEVLKSETPHPVAQTTSTDSFLEVLDELNKRYEELKGGCGTADATISLQRVGSELGYEDMNSVTPEEMALEALKRIEKLTRVKKMMEEAARPF